MLLNEVRLKAEKWWANAWQPEETRCYLSARPCRILWCCIDVEKCSSCKYFPVNKFLITIIYNGNSQKKKNDTRWCYSIYFFPPFIKDTHLHDFYSMFYSTANRDDTIVGGKNTFLKCSSSITCNGAFYFDFKSPQNGVEFKSNHTVYGWKW